MITESEQIGMDIDWYFTNLEQVGFVTSGGGTLPRSVAVSAEDLELLYDYFNSLPFVSGIIIDPKLDNKANRQYLEGWIGMAKRGLYTYDKTAYNDSSDSRYHIVAKPLIPLKYLSLPDAIQSILARTVYIGALDDFTDSDLIA